MTRLRAFFLLLLLISIPTFAQTTNTNPDHLHIRVITMGPGSDPWEKFGHDCIEIQDTETGSDLSYNWGVFSFGEGFSGFVTFGWHFIQGRLWYMMLSEPTDQMLPRYFADGRSVLVQELNLTPDQKLALQSRLMAMDTDANRFYLYDYFKKNCSTRVRDEIDQSVNGQIAATLKNLPTNTTYRWHDRRLTAGTPWLYFFLDYSLGHPVDQPLSAWQESFLPEKLAIYLRTIHLPDGHGGFRPLVKWERQLTPSTYTVRDSPPNPFFIFLASGGGFAVILYGLGALGRKRFVARWAFNLLAMAWSLIAGLLGLLMTYVWFSDHLAAMWNENWFQGNPLSLLLVVLMPASRRWPRAASIVAITVLALSAIDLIAKITPWASQPNGAMIALALPVHTAIAAALFRLSQSATPNESLQPRIPMI